MQEAMRIVDDGVEWISRTGDLEKPGKRRRRKKRSCDVVFIPACLASLMILLSSTPTTSAFRSTPFGKLTRSPFDQSNARGSLIKDTKDGTTTESEEEKSSRRDWFNWMTQGSKLYKPRGTGKIIMREAEALGGLPRGDRYSSRDWFHNTITLPNSAILKSVASPVISVTSWATFLSVLHHKLLQTNAAAATHMYIPSTPHSLMMSALGLLLVFRTNAAYQRFAEGRAIWERIVNVARDLSRMVMLYDSEIGVDKRRRIQRLLVSFPYLLRHRIRPNLVMRRLDDEEYTRDPENTILLYQDTGMKDNDPEAAELAKAEEVTGISRRKKRPLYWVDKRTLPWRLLPSNDALEKCARAQNRPLWVCDRLAAEIRNVPDQPSFTSRERLTLLKQVDALSKTIGGAERIHQTTVPLNYARHTLRALTLWLFSLPFCLVKDLKFLTGPMLFLVSWLLFGVYEIGYAIEDPFQGSLRLSILCDSIRRDVIGDETIRNSAFELEFLKQNDDEEIEGINGRDLIVEEGEGVVGSAAGNLTSSSDAYQ